MRKIGEVGLLMTGLSLSMQATAANPAWQCPVPATIKAQEQRLPQPPHPLKPIDVQSAAIHIEADQALFRSRGESLLEGDIIISRGSTMLMAEQARFNQQTEQVKAAGNVWLISDGLKLHSEKLDYSLKNDTGSMEQSEYQLVTADGRGKSERLTRESVDITRMRGASYTTCPLGNDSWSLNAGEIELNHATEQGEARNVTLRIQDTPVLYLPYFTFPLTDKRQSGLLIPSLSTDEKSGLRISVPYYVNLAPNYDLTLTPNLISKRGLQLESEFRYLFPKHDGQFNIDVLPKDNDRDDQFRYHYDFEHFSHLGPNSEFSLQAEGVSDNNYFNDLGTSLAASSIVKLERTLSYQTQQADWSFSALAQDYQVLDEDTAAYARLPQLSLNWEPDSDDRGLRYYAQSEYTFFSDNNALDGHRFDIAAGISKTYETPAFWAEASTSVQHTQYLLDREQDDQIHRTLPTASLGAGYIFERPLRGGKWLQTLEPGAFYTFTPYRDQSQIPVFDSSAKTLSYSQLFSSNRFTGKDRVEDANRLSTSLTTRIQDVEHGREIFRASIGQMIHFNDRQVTLPDETLSINTRSELVLEAAGELNKSTRLSSTAFIDTETRQVNASQFRLNYKDQKERVVNLGYGQRRNEYEAAHLSFATPLSPGWKLAAGYEQDLKNERMLESVLGLEYRSCCWKGRVAARKYLLSDNKTYDDAIFVEVELKGLGNFGSNASNFLGNRIYGYE